jgi:hypothetical protein
MFIMAKCVSTTLLPPAEKLPADVAAERPPLPSDTMHVLGTSAWSFAARFARHPASFAFGFV